MTDSSKRRVSLVAELTPGTVPANPVWMPLNRTTSNLKPNIQRIESRLIRPTRDILDNVTVRRSAGGSLDTELQYDVTGGLWRLFKSAIQSATEVAATTEVTSVTGSGGNTLTGTGVHTGVQVGDVVRVRVTAGSVYVGHYRVTAVATDVLTVEGAGAEINVSGLGVLRGIRLVNGSTTYTSSIQVADDTDGNGVYDKFEVFTNKNVDTMRLRVADGEITQLSFGFIGADSDGGTGAETSGSTYASPPATEVMNSKDHVKAIRFAATNFSAKEFEFNSANAMAPRTVIGTLPAISIRSGTLRIQGRVTAYFANFTEYSKAVAGTASAALIVFRDSSAKSIAFSIPKIKYSDQEKPDTGQDTDIFVNLTWSALNEGGSDATSIRILAFAN